MATTTEIKNIFLSASIPLLERDPKYIEMADIIAIRDSVIALTTVALPHHRIIWGGHPSITPLIYYVMGKLNLNIQEHVKLYQSQFFEEFFPADNNKFKNITITDAVDDDRDKSLEHMRKRMFQENEFVAGIFIGGMKGVEDEYNMFIKEHPDAILLPVSSTGAAAKIIYDDLLPKNFKNEELVKNYGYMSLFQKLLIDKI